MAIKYTILGLIIYVAMAFYLAAGLALAGRRTGLGRVLFLLGFLVTTVGFGLRWHDAGHVPLQNMFEVFLCLGLLIYPISLFCRRVLRVGGEAADALLGVILLFPAGLVFHAEPQRLPPALQSPLFIPHVTAYMVSYVIMAKACVAAVAQLANRSVRSDGLLVHHEEAAYRMVLFGFPLLTLGLVLGAWWGKLAWGDYWSWDPKELWSLVSWLIFLGYLHVRYLDNRRHPRLGSILIILGLAAIIVTLLWVNLSRIFPGMHSYAS